MAIQTTRATSLMHPQLGVTHRIVLHRSAVRSTCLQQPQSWSTKEKNVCNSKNDAYNSLGTIYGLLSIMYVRHPVDPGEGAFVMDTCQSFLCA
jgi:hypothetical protein